MTSDGLWAKANDMIKEKKKVNTNRMIGIVVKVN